MEVINYEGEWFLLMYPRSIAITGTKIVKYIYIYELDIKKFLQ